MKKLIYISILIVGLFVFNNYKSYVIIPEDSIRFRVIPNSNSVKDIYIKELVLSSVQSKIKAFGQYNDLKTSREVINDNIKEIDDTINNIFKENDYEVKYNVNYGLNYFPEKIYKGVKYKSGYYESLVVEIGASEGSNFWCVMFPPLCFLEAEESDEVEYKFFVSELIDRIFSNKKSSSQ